MFDYSSLASGGLGLVSGLFSGFGARAAAKKYLQGVRETNELNKYLAEYSYQQNLAQWNRENEYNTPANQMQRLIDAGLNPNLAYSGSGSADTAASSPNYDAPTMEAPSPAAYSSPYSAVGSAIQNSVTGALNTYLSLKQQQNQDKLTDAQSQYYLASAGLRNIDSDLKERHGDELALSQISEHQSATARNFSQKDLNEANTWFIKEWKPAVADSEIQLNKALEKLNLAKEKTEDEKRQYVIEEMIQKIELLKAQINETNESCNLMSKQGNLLDAKTAGQYIANNMSQLEYEFAQFNDSWKRSETVLKTMGLASDTFDKISGGDKSVLVKALKTGQKISFVEDILRKMGNNPKPVRIEVRPHHSSQKQNNAIYENYGINAD